MLLQNKVLLDQLFDLKSKVMMNHELQMIFTQNLHDPSVKYSLFDGWLKDGMQEQELQDQNKDLRKKVVSLSLHYTFLSVYQIMEIQFVANCQHHFPTFAWQCL